MTVNNDVVVWRQWSTRERSNLQSNRVVFRAAYFLDSRFEKLNLVNIICMYITVRTGVDGLYAQYGGVFSQLQSRRVPIDIYGGTTPFDLQTRWG